MFAALQPNLSLLDVVLLVNYGLSMEKFCVTCSPGVFFASLGVLNRHGLFPFVIHAGQRDIPALLRHIDVTIDVQHSSCTYTGSDRGTQPH